MKKNGCNYRGLLASTVFLSAGVLLTVAPVNVKAANNNSSTMATTVIASNNASSNTGSATTDQSADNTVNSTNVVSYDSSDSIDDGNDNQSNISNNADIVTMNSSEQDNNVDNDSEAQGNISPSDPTESQVTSTADASTDTNTAQAEVSQETVSPEYSQTETLENNVDNQSNSAISADDSNKSDNQAEEKSDMTQAKLQSVSKSDNQVQVESANKENSAKQLMAYSSPVATNNKYQFKTASVAAAVQSTQWTWLPVPIYIPGRLVDATIGAITSIPGLSGLGGPLNAIRYVLTPPWAIALNSASGLLNNMIVSGLTNLFPNNSSIQTIIGELENPLLGDSLPIRIFLPIPLVTPPTTPETPVTPPTTPETPVTPPTTPETPVTPPTTPETPVTPVTPPTTPVTNKPNIPFKPSNNKVTKVNISKPKVVTTQNTGKEQPKLKQIVKAGFANKLPQTGDSKANTTTLMAIGTGLLIATLGLAYRAFKRI